MRLPSGRGVAGWVAASRQAVAIDDLQGDPRFARDVAEGTGYVPRALLAVPVQSPHRLLGVMTLLDRDAARPGADDDMALLSLFADQAALAVEAAQAFGDVGRVLLGALSDAAGTGTDLAAALDRAADGSPRTTPTWPSSPSSWPTSAAPVPPSAGSPSGWSGRSCATPGGGRGEPAPGLVRRVRPGPAAPGAQPLRRRRRVGVRRLDRCGGAGRRGRQRHRGGAPPGRAGGRQRRPDLGPGGAGGADDAGAARRPVRSRHRLRRHHPPGRAATAGCTASGCWGSGSPAGATCSPPACAGPSPRGAGGQPEPVHRRAGRSRCSTSWPTRPTSPAWSWSARSTTCPATSRRVRLRDLRRRPQRP